MRKSRFTNEQIHRVPETGRGRARLPAAHVDRLLALAAEPAELESLPITRYMTLLAKA